MRLPLPLLPDWVTCSVPFPVRSPHAALLEAPRPKSIAGGGFRALGVGLWEDRSRRSAFGRLELVLAADVDIAVIVAAVAQPAFHPKLVDRFLVRCRYDGTRATCT